eukprot:6911659-Pyramimonas_sp.AAC.1
MGLPRPPPENSMTGYPQLLELAYARPMVSVCEERHKETVPSSSYSNVNKDNDDGRSLGVPCTNCVRECVDRLVFA